MTTGLKSLNRLKQRKSMVLRSFTSNTNWIWATKIGHICLTAFACAVTFPDWLCQLFKFHSLRYLFVNQDSDDSDEEEEQNSIKTDHDHKQYELTMKAIQETLLKKPDD